MLISLEKSVNLSRRFGSISKKLQTPSLENLLRQARIKLRPIDFLNAILLNSLLYALLFSALFTVLFISQSGIAADVIIKGVSIGFLLGMLFFIILYNYPRIIARRIGQIIDSELFFALNDMLIQLKAKVELYKTLVNIVEGGYGYISDELLDVVNEVESGKSMITALRNLALRTKSEFLKKMAWQLINSSKSGSDVVTVMQALIREVEVYYHSLINNYSKELNVLTLIYLTLAVVAPTIGITIMIILSSFGNLPLNQSMITLVVSVLLTIQPIFIGFINSRRPLVKI